MRTFLGQLLIGTGWSVVPNATTPWPNADNMTVTLTVRRDGA